jgi:hypothetical protein
MRFLLLFVVIAASSCFAQTIKLSDSQALEIGRRIWKNESGATVSGLTAWNAGEGFASLGIAHFIWYPKGPKGPFEESFPKLAAYLAKQGAPIPQWMHGACPWNSRAKFMADFEGPKMRELRSLLKRTIAEQASFAALRLENALPKMLAAAPSSDRERIKANFYRVAGEPLGLYALMDYVNFKGEGVNPGERYRGQGWGLLQVLAAMPHGGAPLPGFVKAADQVLTRRVSNSPPARNEDRWLPGWRNRLRTYLN